jgi:hypothetical protein
MAGNFSTMPVPFMWEQSVEFAHIIDGYGIAGGVRECMEDRVAALIEASIAANTRRAYRSDLAHFVTWGGQRNRRRSPPISPPTPRP